MRRLLRALGKATLPMLRQSQVGGRVIRSLGAARGERPAWPGPSKVPEYTFGRGSSAGVIKRVAQVEAELAFRLQHTEEEVSTLSRLGTPGDHEYP